MRSSLVKYRFSEKESPKSFLPWRKGEFPPPSEVIPAIDPALEAICLMAMAHAPEDRYATARAMADDLEAGSPTSRSLPTTNP